MSQSGVHGSGDPEALQAHVDATREQLARTLDDLAARMDVRSRAHERLLRLRDTVVETYRESPPVVLGAAALLAVAVGTAVWRKKR